MSGQIPDYEQKIKLETIDLSDNNLEGSLSTFMSLINLRVISLLSLFDHLINSL